MLADAFKALGIERWGGASDNGWSKISDLLRCPYRYYLKHVKGLQSPSVTDGSTAMEIGSYAHAALAAYYAAQLPDDRYPGFRVACPTPEAVLDALGAAGAEAEALFKAREVWAGYVDFHGDDGVTAMGVEVPAGNIDLHTCRYDLIADVQDGCHDGVWAFDHKVVSKRTDLELYLLDGEIMGEALCWDLSGLAETFGPITGVCINALIKEPARGQPPYARRWFPLNEDLIRDFGSNRIFWQSQLAMYKKLGRFPKSHYGCPGRYYGTDVCQFWDHCATLDPSKLVPRSS